MSKPLNLVWMSSDAKRELIEEADDKYELETGGVLMGYSSHRSEFVVQHVIGPGPLAIHESDSFEPDYVYQDRAIQTLFRASNGITTYLGDWHTHPDGAAALSRRDKKTLSRISKTREARIAHPLMLLASGQPSRWSINAWMGSETKIAELSIFCVKVLVVRDFEADRQP